MTSRAKDFDQDESACLVGATVAMANVTLASESEVVSSERGDIDSLPTKPLEKEDPKTATEMADVPQQKLTPKFDRWAVVDPKMKINYGPFSAESCVPDQSKEALGATFYITTAINYTNGAAHMGHAYEATTSDCIARYARASGQYPGGVYFVTGADEHGQKIATTAEKEEKAPLDICNKYVMGFQCLNHRILISNNDYVRTTSDRHKRTAKELWKKCAAAGDIYLDTYEGWYNVREEAFVSESDAALTDFKDPTSGVPLKKMKEESYFFKMSKFHDKLLDHIKTNQEFIQPDQYRKFIISRLEGDDLRDLSISRKTFDWGIPVPEGFAEKHVMYVWIDALSNYLTGVDALHVNGESQEYLSKLWPANVHIIGKDILWFHTVIWPCLLMSAGVPLPKTVFSHGFVNDKEGKKMSKSMGNVVDPHDMLDLYSVDTFRWYLCKEAPYGGELAFSEESLRTMHNADLCDTLGNLVHRATNLAQKHCGGAVPDVPSPPKDALDFGSLRASYVEKMNKFELEKGAELAIAGFRDVNGYLTETAPWHLKGDEHSVTRMIIVRAVLESVYALAHLLAPFIPNGAEQIFRKLGTEPSTIRDLNENLRNLKVGTKISVGDVLYGKLVSEEELNAAELAKKKADDYAKAQARKKEQKQKQMKSSQAGQAAASSDQPDFTKLDIRVGQIVKAWYHEDADKLFCEEIDVGEAEGPRQIASGLRQHYTLEDFSTKKVLVVCNMKASKIVGFSSNGMVLAAKSLDGKTVELVEPPENAKVGERVFVEGLVGDPFSPAQVKKKKVMETVAEKLRTGEDGVAQWDGKNIMTTVGPCAAASLAGAAIG